MVRENGEIEVGIDLKDSTLVKDELTVVKPGMSTMAEQTYKNTFSGWQAYIWIKFTDDGTYACLTHCYGEWTKVSGNASISNKSITWGQDLGTNPMSRYRDMAYSSMNVTTLFSPGKYGYNCGHKVGCTMNAKIAGKTICAQCNYWF